MEKFKNLVIYGGINKQQYQKIRNDITVSNRESLIEYTVVSFTGMLIMFILSFFVPVLAPSRLSYAILVLASAVLFSLAKWVGEKNQFAIHFGVYFFEVLLLVFGIYLGTIVEPNEASSSFGILLFAVPLLFIDAPIVTASELIAAIVIYVAAAKSTQSPEMYGFNMSFVLPYGIIAVIMCVLIIRIKIIKLYLNYENKTFSERDELTGLYNRRVYESELSKLRNGELSGTLLFFEFDLNGLKEVNDTKGHAAGDEIIVGLSGIMTDVLGKYGKCFRTGGDEFFAILQGSALKADELISEMYLKCKAYNKVHSTQLSYAVGAKSLENEFDLENVLAETDRLMYESKQMYYFNRNSEARHDVDWNARNNYESRFEEALKNKRFAVFCQPKYSAVGGSMTSAEALVRWIKEDGTMIGPGDFISVFEGNSQIIALDKYMFRSVCEIQKNFIDSGITPVPISVNISRVSLFSIGMVDALCRIAETAGIPKNLVPLEITESAAFDSTHFAGIVKDLKRAGFMLHMDDFGHGYSSLNNLRLMPFDTVKIDKTLIDDIGNNGCDEILKHVIELAHFLKMEVVAEGVESEAQCNFLKQIACDTIQGYYFSKAVNLTEFTSRLKEKDKNSPVSAEVIREMEDEASVGSLKLTNDLKLRYLQAMSSIYMTVHVIDLRDNTTTEFATTTNVKEHSGKTHGADIQMQTVMKNVVSTEYVDRVLKFVDFTDLPERMRGKRTISMDFVGTHFGWTRGRFISVEVNENNEPTVVIFTTQVIEADRKSENLISVCVTDELTGVFNREAYYRDSQRVNSGDALVGTNPDILNISVYRIDQREDIVRMAGLSSWDDVVVGAALILNKAFHDSGKIYRTDDNEFVVLSYMDQESLDAANKEINKECDNWLSARIKRISMCNGNVVKTEFPAHKIDALVDIARDRCGK